MWTLAQRERLALEHQMLQSQGMGQFSVFHDSRDDSYYLSGTAQTNAGRSYDLFASIPQGFPDHRPALYVTNPNPLRMAAGRALSDLGISHSMHTLSPAASGAVQICHWRDAQWHAAITLHRVMLKALLWLEAYEQHLATGRSIDAFVRTMGGST
jgi:hypothetical protein